MFGFIKKLISGILAFISGLFAGKKADAEQSGAGKAVKKSSGYFLELDEAKSNGQSPAKTAASAPAKTEVAPAKTEAAPAKAESTPAPAQPAKAEAVKAAPAKAEPVKAVAQSTNGSKPAPAATPAPTATAAFASTPTVPNTFGDRRRPGANMDYFLDMARQRQAKASS